MISLSIFLIVLALVFVAKGVIIVQQAEVVIVERLGKFDRVLQSGFNFIIPVLEAPRAIDWKVTQKGFDGSTYSIIQKRTKINQITELFKNQLLGRNMWSYRLFCPSLFRCFRRYHIFSRVFRHF